MGVCVCACACAIVRLCLMASSDGFVATFHSETPQIRDQGALRVRLFTYLFFGVLVGTMYWRLDNGQSSAQGRVSVLFLAAVFCGMVSVAIIPKIVGSRATVFRETTSNTCVVGVLARWVAGR